ncbi:MAG: hypothetical protein GF307_06910 [candidate division Zixibacteria bacterium]|nr:hypothetical protein [candidate division Zixibacteria bacterium]
MFIRYLNFVRGVSVNWVGKLGVILTSSSFITFIALEIARLSGMLTNAYVGLITYMLFPTIFVIGLILIPIGWFKYQKGTGKSSRELLNERFNPDESRAEILGSKVFRIVILLTLVNVIFMIAASAQTMHFMDSARFCGTACHSVMNPEWATYQESPHARVACVECHVGEGVDALINSKLNGLYQVLSVTFNLYEKPIPTPVHQLRPARETCEKCHWPQKFYGQKIKTITHYQHDENSTPRYTTLSLKIDTGPPGKRKGIHWHIASENEVRYASLEDRREEIIWVELKQVDGSYRRFTNPEYESIEVQPNEIRIMDCVDCHNRATHIYEDPVGAVNDRISSGLISEKLPYIAREAYDALTVSVADTQMALDGIGYNLRNFYEENYRLLSKREEKKIDSTIMVLRDAYRRNIHPEMNITWGSYRSHIGHKGSNFGCFRCHNSRLADRYGNHISNDCTVCHSIMAFDSEKPFEYLTGIDSTTNAARDYLKDEFTGGNQAGSN